MNPCLLVQNAAVKQCDLDTKKTNEYGDMEIVFFIQILYTASVQKLNARIVELHKIETPFARKNSNLTLLFCGLTYAVS
jgi:hypothetical protein